MCPASYTNTYKYRIYNVHERASSSSTPQSASSKTMSLDRRNLDMYRSFSKPQRQHHGHSLFYRSLVRGNHYNLT